MQFFAAGRPKTQFLKQMADGLKSTFKEQEHQSISEPTPKTDLVLNFCHADDLHPFRRNLKSSFVASMIEVDSIRESANPENILNQVYPYVIRTLSDLAVIVSSDAQSRKVNTFIVTLERGLYQIKKSPLTHQYYQQLYDYIIPLASATSVTDNIFIPDLPEHLRCGCEAVEQIRKASRKFAEESMLPEPLPLEQFLSRDDRKHLEQLTGRSGISYGNVSARHNCTEKFWISASGVDKTNLTTIGRDILLVNGYDPEKNAMVISTLPDVQPQPASVDAIEHWFIYNENPSVRAILHLHAWMEDIPVTDMNYPCGTYELGRAAADKLKTLPEPEQAVIGLRNHGLTATGKSVPEIFARIEDNLDMRVPMM